ncbi:MAG: T3SS effector HopA1 family protein [Candidatus Nanopelagicales bacterium]
MPDSAPLRTALGPLLAAVRVDGRVARWFGERIELVPRGAALGRASDDLPTQALTQLLYTYYYTVSRPVLRQELDSLMRNTAPRSLASQLAAANPGAGRREGGWRCVRVRPEQGRVVVHKGDLAVSAPVQLVRPRAGGSVGPGQSVVVDTPAGSLNRSAGFYVAHSDADLDYLEPLTRMYVNVSPDGAAEWLHDACTRLNGAGLPFDLKVANDAAHFHRCDVAVLYFPRRLVPAFWQILAPLLADRVDQLRSTVPGLVLRVRPGVGVADDPANGRSFGLDRCRAIAAGLLHAASDGPIADPLTAVSAALADGGIDPTRPHLHSGREDVYAQLL